MTGRTLAAIALLGALLAGTAAAEITVGDSLEAFGADLLSGPYEAVLRGDTAFVLYPSGLAVLDISNPLHMEEIWSGYVPGAAGGLLIRDSILYVSRRSAGLFTIDVSDPSAPVFLDTIPASMSFGRVATGYNRLYVADARSGLLVYDVRQPIPSPLSDYETDEEIADLVIDGGVAYLAFHGMPLQLVDISFYIPSLLSEIAGMEGAKSLAVDGPTLYASLGAGGIVTADVSDSTAPSMRADAYPAGVEIGDIAVIDTFLVAVRDSVDLILMRADSLGAGALGLGVSDSTLVRISKGAGGVLAVSQQSGFQFVDLVIPQSAAYVSSITFSGVGVTAVAVEGDTAYLAAGAAGIFLVSLADEENLDSLGRIPTSGTTNGLDVRDGLVYAAESNVGLRVYDAASGSAIGFASLRGSSQQVRLAGDMAYVCGGSSGLLVLDVTTPSTPALVDSIPTGGVAGRTTRDLTLRGNLLALAEGDAGVRLVDVSDPGAPSVLGAFDTDDYAIAAAFSEAGYLYVALRSSGLLVLDVSDPAAPDSVGFVSLPVGLFLISLDVLGNVVYVTENLGFGVPGRIHVVGIADPTRPSLLMTLDAGGVPGRVLTTDTRAYVAAGIGGLEIYGFFEDYGFIRAGSYRPWAATSVIASSDAGALIADTDGKVWPFTLGEGEVLQRGNAIDLGSSVGDMVMDGSTGFASLPDEGVIARIYVPTVGDARVLSLTEVQGEPTGLALRDTILYACLGSAGFATYHTGGTGDIAVIGSFVSGDGYDLGASGSERVVVEGTVAYLTTRDQSNSLYLLDVSDPAAPSVLSTFPTDYRALDVGVLRGYAYLLSRVTGCSILDVRDPSNPTRVIDRGDFSTPRRIEVLVDYLFVARRDFGVTVYDATNAVNPVLVWSEDTPGVANDIAIFGANLAVSDRSAFRVYRQGFANTDDRPPVYAVGILPNPFVNAFVDFVIASSEALIDKPEVRFVMGETDSILNVLRLDTPRNVYHAPFRFAETGVGTVEVSGEDLAGNKSETSKGFSVAFLRGSKGGSIYDTTGKVEVRVPPRGGDSEEAVLLAAAEEWEVGGGAPEAIRGPFRLSLGRFDGPVTVTAREIDPVEGETGPGVFRLEGGDWIPVDAVYDPGARSLKAELPGSTIFLVSAEGEASPPPAPPVTLESNRPNPFNPSTTVVFRLAEAGRAKVGVYDIAGRRVRNLADGRFPSGATSVV